LDLFARLSFVMCSLYQTFRVDEIKEDGAGWRCSPRG